MPNDPTRQDEAREGGNVTAYWGDTFSSSCLALLTLYNLFLTQLRLAQLSIPIYLLAVHPLIHLSHRLITFLPTISHMIQLLC